MAAKNFSVRVFFDDVIYQLQAYGGITNYWRRLTDHSNFSNSSEIIRTPECKQRLSLLERQWLKFAPVDIPSGYDGIFHSSYYRLPRQACKTVVTMHDFIFERYGSFASRRLNRLHIGRAIKNADAIICISEATQLDLSQYFPRVDASKIVVIPHGVDHGVFAPSANLLTQANLDVALFIGSRASYKNFETAALAVKIHGEFCLGITGQQLSRQELEFLSKNRIPYVFFGLLSEEALSQKIREAICYLSFIV